MRLGGWFFVLRTRAGRVSRAPGIKLLFPAEALDPALADAARPCLLAVKHPAGKAEAATCSHLKLDGSVVRAAVLEIDLTSPVDDQLVVRHRDRSNKQ